jgi:HK97 family phage portal protein
LGGNGYVARVPGGVMVLRPDWTSIVIGSMDDPDVAAWDVNSEVLGYVYQPGGPQGGRDPVVFLADEVAHFAPIPDPEARFRGMSWLTPVIREIQSDKAATDHKQRFFENGATPNMIVKFPVNDLEQFRVWTEKFKEDHEGRRNAYKTLFLAAGMDATVVGANLEQVEFKATQGAGETRIAAAAGVPPIIAGFSEGLSAATYSNYGQARRAFADATLRPLWRNAAGSLARIVNVPNGAELWYDDRDISFLQEDMKDAAEVSQQKAIAMKTLVDAGYKPDSVVTAVESDDLSLLVHSGLVSVQLQPPGTEPKPASESGPDPELGDE